MPHDKNNYFYFIEKISKALKKKKKKKPNNGTKEVKNKLSHPSQSFFFWGVGGVLLNM
jgi:hypothetical protein